MDIVLLFHDRLFFAQMLYSFGIGLYAAWLGASKKPLSGNFWGTIAVYALLNVVVLVLGSILLLNAYTIQSGGRSFIYVLYMIYLIVILPGLFSIFQGRDDRNAALTFGALAMFNAAVSLSMLDRGLASLTHLS